MLRACGAETVVGVEVVPVEGTGHAAVGPLCLAGGLAREEVRVVVADCLGAGCEEGEGSEEESGGVHLE